VLKRLQLLAKSLLAGGAATIADLGAMFAMVSFLGMPPRFASIPALVLAGAVNFLGNRHVAFRAQGGAAAQQAKRFACVHLVTLTLNAVLFDLAMRGIGKSAPFWVARLVVSNVVYLGWSFPMFRRVFRVADQSPISRSSSSARTLAPSSESVRIASRPTGAQ
jgi:putative flippase GtrA